MFREENDRIAAELERARAAIRSNTGDPLKMHLAVGIAMALEWVLQETSEAPTDNLGDD